MTTVREVLDLYPEEDRMYEAGLSRDKIEPLVNQHVYGINGSLEPDKFHSCQSIDLQFQSTTFGVPARKYILKISRRDDFRHQ